MNAPLWTYVEPLEARIAPAFASQVDLADLNGKNGFKLTGMASHDPYRGISVSDAGDVNDDGFADFLVGADRPADGAGHGAAYVVFGTAAGYPLKLDVASLDGHNGFKLVGETGDDEAGFSVSGAGDVNGDGFADVIIGAIFANTDQTVDGRQRGAAYVLFGKGNGFTPEVELANLDGSDGFKLSGTEVGGRTGYSVSGAGDVNGDGFSDVIIGATQPLQTGLAYVVFGKADGYSANLKLSALDGNNGFKLKGVGVYDRTGVSVSSAGDINGDGFADMIVGASFANPHGMLSGVAYVVFGRADSFGSSLDLSALDGTNGFKLNGEAAYNGAGDSVSGLGDINGDGFDDLIVSAVGVEPNGAAYVVFGKAGAFAASLELSALDGSNGFKLNGVSAHDSAGNSVSGAGDVNGDGFADLIVGTILKTSKGNSGGAAYVLFGNPAGFPANVELSALDGHDGFALNGIARDDVTGFSVSGAGDINGDGFADLLIGAYGLDLYHDPSRGVAYVVFGGDPGRLMISKSGQSAFFTDIDGDRVTVTTTAGTFTKEMFDLRAEGLGFQLEKLDLTDPVFTKANLTFTAVAKDATGDDVKDGNKMVNVGFLDATGVKLASVTIPGDLGQIDAAKTKTLSLASLGAFGTATQDATMPSLHSDIALRLNHLNIAGDIGTGVTLAIGGKLGTAAIGGNVDGATISVLGKLAPTSAADAVAIASLTIGGHVNDSQILAGYDLAGMPMNADVSIGTVIVRGAWSASSLVAGVVDSTDDGFGRNDMLIPNGLDDIIASIASIKIKGTVMGSANPNEFFGITAESIGKARITGRALPLTPEKDECKLDGINENFWLVEVEA